MEDHSDAKKSVCIVCHSTEAGEVSSATQRIIEEKVQEGFDRLIAGKPLIWCDLSEDKRLVVQIIAHRTQDTLRGSCDTLSFWLPQGIDTSTFTIERTPFSIDACPTRSFLFLDATATLMNEESARILKEGLASLRQQIALFLELPPVCQQTVLALPASPYAAGLRIRQECVHWLSSHPTIPPAEFLHELQRVLLATDSEFKALRTPAHLMRLARSHLWLSSHHTSHLSPSPLGKQLFCRIFCSKLHFPFGTKQVLCLAISLPSLSPYEQFDDRHIMLACKRCLPCLEPVPRSFYMYTYAGYPSVSLYMEVEKSDGTLLTANELKMLKQELGRELSSSIEQVMSRIDLPHNEEDLLRNFLLLSQQVRTSKSLPQVVIQFHGQTDTSLDFHVTLVRPVKEKETKVPLPPLESSPITRCVLVRSSVVDTLHPPFIKQGLVFLVECSKQRFLRRDRSVDFLKAREAVVNCIESAYGTIRDLNGGLIYQQHQLLSNITSLLTQEEGKEISLIEDMFHSLSPAIMKNILSPEHIVTLFRQLSVLRADIRKNKDSPFVVEEYSKELFIGFSCPPAFSKDAVLLATSHFHLKENEIALCNATADGQLFCFVICLSQDSVVRQKLPEWLREKIYAKRGVKASRTFRMCLPRPTLLLDPRIGADRTSGAVIKMLYEGLVRLDTGENPSLALAEEVLISDDGKTYTFKLRQSYWSNGQPVTAHDFEYAWKKVLDPSFHTEYDYLFHPILNARLVKAGRLVADELGVHAINDHILVVELERPLPYFLELCALWIYSPLCRDIDKTYPGWAYYGDRTYVCNGPFKLDRISRKGDIHLVKNDRYWDKERVFLEKIDLCIVEDPLLALHMFEQKELDWIGDPLSEVPLTSLKGTGSSVESRSLSSVYCYMLNVHNPLFRSSKIRHAFSSSLSRSEIIKNFLYGEERPAHSVISSSISLLDEATPLPYDLDRACRLFEEGLREEGLSKSHLKPLTLMIYNKEPFKTLASYAAVKWEEAFGISIAIESYGWNEFTDRVISNSYEIVGTFLYSGYRDPAFVLKALSNPRNPFNATKWTNEGVKNLIERAELEVQKAPRNALLREAERLLMEELPAIPIYEYLCRYMKSEDVENIHVNYLGNVEPTWATFKKEEGRLPSAEVPVASEPQEVRLYLQAEPLSLDPRIEGGIRAQVIIRALFEGLTRVGKDGHIELALAKSFSVSDDGCVYTFHLHPSLWSNGAAVTADDFVYAWKSILDPSFSSKYYYSFFPIKNAKPARRKECSLDDVGLKALTPLTLQIELECPAPYFLELLSNPIFSPVCREVAATSPDWAKRAHPNFVSNGPFILGERINRSHITLLRNPHYWNKEEAKSERLSFTIVSDPKKAHEMFIKGKLDWFGEPLGSLPLDRASDLDRQGLLIKKKTGTIFWLNCRTDAPHIRSPKIRKAISFAINRIEICEDLLKGGEEPAYSLLPPSMSLLGKPPVAERAKQLFLEGLQEVGISAEHYPPLIISHWADPTVTAIVQKIQQQLQHALGIRVELSLLDWKDYIRKLGSGDYQVQTLVWHSWYDDPLYNLEYLKYKDSGLNGTGWERAEYISLLDRANSAETPALRLGYLQRAEAYVMEELPVIPIFYRTCSFATSSNLTGQALSSTGALEMKWMAKIKRE